MRWAFAYVKAEVDGKIALVFANDNAKERPEEALAARILGMLDPDKGVSVKVLTHRLRIPATQIAEILGRLESSGMVAQKIGKRLYRGQKVVHWFPAEQ